MRVFLQQLQGIVVIKASAVYISLLTMAKQLPLSQRYMSCKLTMSKCMPTYARKCMQLKYLQICITTIIVDTPATCQEVLAIRVAELNGCM